MTHEHVLERLDDWAGGELPPPERAAVDLHLAGCTECRTEAEAIRGLLAEVGGLPREIFPERDLWGGIAARLEPRAAAPASNLPARSPARVPRWVLQAAAVVALMVGSSLATLYWPGRGAVPGTTGPVVVTGPRPEITALAAFAPAEADYRAAIGDLQAVLETQRDLLAPATVQTLETNLAIIDEAIRQSREALARDPNSPELARMLADAYGAKLGVLQQVVQL